eukprot:2294091-Amphidinium_carterae.1
MRTPGPCQPFWAEPHSAQPGLENRPMSKACQDNRQRALPGLEHQPWAACQDNRQAEQRDSVQRNFFQCIDLYPSRSQRCTFQSVDLRSPRCTFQSVDLRSSRSQHCTFQSVDLRSSRSQHWSFYQ